MRNHNAPRSFRFLATTAVLWIGVAACDSTTTSDDDVARSLPCNLADEECATLPVAADAVVLLESLDVDVHEADVELVEDLDEAMDAADARQSIDRLTTELPPPEEQRWTCNGGDGTMCCCLWDGPEWGCYCN